MEESEARAEPALIIPSPFLRHPVLVTGSGSGGNAKASFANRIAQQVRDDIQVYPKFRISEILKFPLGSSAARGQNIN